jgi:hypothetical protein
VAVEHGLHVLFITLACFCALVLVAIRHRERHWVASAGVCIVAWGGCNIWSSLWCEPSLWVPPGISAMLILSVSLRAKIPVARVALMAAGSALLVTVALPAGGYVLSKGKALKAVPLAHADAVLLTRRTSPGTTVAACEVWTDGLVFDRYFGRTVRALIQENPPGSLVVYSPWADAAIADKPRANKRIYSGFQAGRVNDEEIRGSKIIILHPTVPPPSSPFRNNADLTVCLPQFDTFGCDLTWRRWTAGTGSRLIYSPSAGPRLQAGDESIKFWDSLFMQ